MQDHVVLGRTAKAAYVLLVVAAAYTGAVAISSVVAFFLDPGPQTAADVASAVQPHDQKATRAPRINYGVIFERNLFGSEPIVVSEQRPGPATAEVELRLRGTAMLDGKGFAVIEELGDGRQDVFTVGERVFEGPRLVGVYERRAVLLHKGRRMTLEILDDEADAPEPRRGARAGKAAAKDQAAELGIRPTGPNTYLVDRREVEHSIENLNTVITQMRAVPYLRDGKSLGFRVFNIRPDSIFERMGLKNGDVIQNVNGSELASPSQALGLLDAVQSADEIVVNLLRNDEPNTMTYTIR